jgi:NDP-sugar pyrophosphorylase family protein
MANVAGRPILELLLLQLHRHGFERAILAVGYQKDTIESHFGERACGLCLTYSAESFPLGTGGALRNALDLVESESVLTMNGDSHTDADIGKFVAGHRETKTDASLIVVPADGRGDCGSVQVDVFGRLARFDEKQGSPDARYVNAGIYILSRTMLCDIPSRVCVSLERDLFPRWLAEGRDIRVFVHPGRCIDIGTPERYHAAQDVLADVETGVSAAAGVDKR